MQDFIERHSTKIKGVISCFGRIVLTGTIPGICYAQGMSAFLTAQNIRIFDFTQWAEPLREEIRANAEKIAHDNGLKIEFIRKKNFRKEDVRSRATFQLPTTYSLYCTNLVGIADVVCGLVVHKVSAPWRRSWFYECMD